MMCPAETPEGQVSVVACANANSVSEVVDYLLWDCYFVVMLGLWTSEESRFDGVHNCWISCMSYL